MKTKEELAKEWVETNGHHGGGYSEFQAFLAGYEAGQLNAMQTLQDVLMLINEFMKTKEK
jgi:hypothetical protein